jgi:hypothetical protein
MKFHPETATFHLTPKDIRLTGITELDIAADESSALALVLTANAILDDADEAYECGDTVTPI